MRRWSQFGKLVRWIEKLVWCHMAPGNFKDSDFDHKDHKDNYQGDTTFNRSPQRKTKAGPNVPFVSKSAC